MGATKSELFTKKQNDLANICRVLGHPARIAILQHLLKTDGCIGNELVAELGLAQATTSQHLKELKQAGFIRGTIAGAGICYCIDDKAWQRYKKMFTTFFINIAPTDKICAQPGCCD